MTKSLFLDKYPINSLVIAKDQTKYTNIDEILEFYKTKIQEHPIAAFISTFDHYTHTKNIDGEINPDIKDAKNLIFCFGSILPNAKMLAARPRSIGITELADSFSIDFLDAPNEKLQEVLVGWTKELVN